MSPLSRILALTDFSPPALLASVRAAQLARRHGAELTLLHALGAPGPDLGSAGAAALGSATPVLARAVQDALLRAWDALLAEGPLRGAAELLEGPPHRSLPAWIERHGADLVVIGVHGAGRPRAAMLGSTADRLLRVLDVPLLLVRRDPGAAGYRRVAIASDFSEGAHRAALFGIRLVADAECVLLHADERMFESTLAFAGVAPEVLDEYRRASAIEGMRNLEAEATRLHEATGVSVVPTLREGPPWKALEALVAEVGIELAVVGRAGRSQVERLLLGSTSHFAVSALSCDALVVP
jgi:nucleotide-binding universal stress UspA family protein